MLKGKLCSIAPVEAKDAPEIEDWKKDRVCQSPYLGLALTHPTLTAEDLFKRTTSKSYLVRDKSSALIALMVTDNEKDQDRNIALYLDKKEGSADEPIIEALQLMLQQLFDEKNLHRVYTHTVDSDKASLKIFEKLGFVQEAVLREHLYVNGSYRDVAVLGLLKDEYKKC